METQLEIVTNLGRLLEYLIDENCIISNNVYFEKLISHLAAKDNAYILQASFVVEWIDRCLNILNEDISKINPKVISFVFNLFSLLTTNEWNIIEIRQRRLVDKVLEIVKRESHQFNPSIKISIIQLMKAICQYSLGIAHLVSVKIWQFIIKYCNQDHTLYVVREARELLYDILYKYDVKTKDSAVVKEILEEITKPLTENVFETNNENIIVNVEDDELQHKLSATLELLSFIFQKTLESEEKTSIANICMLEENFEITAWKLTDMYHNENFILKVLTTLSSYYYAKFVYDKWNGKEEQIDLHSFSELAISIYNQVKFCIQRSYFVNILKIAEVNYKLWKKLGKRAPKEVYIENELVHFGSQLVAFQLIPVHMILRLNDLEELFEKYMTKIFQLVCEQTLRLCYLYRDSILNMSPSTNVDLSIKSVYSVMSILDIMERDEAIVVFQACIYAFKEFIMKLYQCEQNLWESDISLQDTPSFSILAEHSNTIHAILVSMQTLVERFKITWKDSIETIGLVNCVLQLLLAEDLPLKVTVQSLKLLQLSLEHFLAAGMALLLDDMQDSGLIEMAPMIKKRCHDPNWEVRDSILELVISIASISHIKYPIFQKFLAESWICSIVYDMAQNDTEPYVRASALKCIAELVAIHGIFDGDIYNILDHLLDVIYNESEGIVRKEALYALTRLTQLRKIPNRYRDSVFSILTYTVDSDLYWEAKVQAIVCLMNTSCNMLQQLGMIDGSFPTVTFSKEKRKIVQLNEKEVSQRFSQVLTELSQRGVLGVVLKCLREECDGAVVRAAKGFVKRMVTKMEEHNYEANSTEQTPSSSNSIPTANSNNANPLIANITTTDEVKIENSKTTDLVSSDAEMNQFLDSDEIIESILNSQDIILLTATYTENMHINEEAENSASVGGNSSQNPSSKRPQIDPFYFKKFSNVGVQEYIEFALSIDFNEEKSCREDQWFLCDENFASLLQEIICVVKPEPNNESISADCY